MSNILDVIADLNHTLGANAVRCASETTEGRKIPSGSPALDFVTGGGIPVNRITEILGEYSSTKTLHTLLIISRFQKYDWSNNMDGGIQEVKYKQVIKKVNKDRTLVFNEVDQIIPSKANPSKEPRYKRCVFVDYEGTFDKDWADFQGVDTKGLIYINPPSAAAGVDVIQTLLGDPDIGLIVLDSMHGVGSEAEVDKSMEDDQMAANARFWNKATRKFQAAINSNPEDDVSLIVINSTYDKVGFVMGDPAVVKNGNQMKYAKAMSIKFRALKEQMIKVDGVEIPHGRVVNISTEKSKVCPPNRKASFFYSHLDKKIDIFYAAVELAIIFKVCERAGAWFSYGAVRKQGMENFVSSLKENPRVQSRIIADVYKHIEKIS